MSFENFVNKKLNKRILDTFGKYQVFLVDGDKLRESVADFSDWAIHAHIPEVVPQGEIWIENNSDLTIFKALCYCKFLETNSSLIQAHSFASRRIRSLIDESRKVIMRKDFDFEAVTERTEITQDEMGEDLVIRFVDGSQVRDTIMSDFFMSSNGLVKYHMPRNEIWIEHGLLPVFTKDCIKMEVDAYNLMKYHDKIAFKAYLQVLKDEQ